MAGCFGNSPYDQHLESQLLKWLDETYAGDNEPEENRCYECWSLLCPGKFERVNDKVICKDCFDALREELPR